MKRIIFVIVLALVGAGASAQCDKKNVIVTNKMERLDANGEVERTRDEILTLTYDGKEIVAIPSEDGPARGPVKSITCEWKTPYKEGKTVVKGTVVDPESREIEVIITIEGKEGKITMLLELITVNRKVRFTVDKFEESK